MKPLKDRFFMTKSQIAQVDAFMDAEGLCSFCESLLPQIGPRVRALLGQPNSKSSFKHGHFDIRVICEQCHAIVRAAIKSCQKQEAPKP